MIVEQKRTELIMDDTPGNDAFVNRDVAFLLHFRKIFLSFPNYNTHTLPYVDADVFYSAQASHLVSNRVVPTEKVRLGEALAGEGCLSCLGEGGEGGC